MARNASPTISVTPLKAGHGYTAKIIWQAGEAEDVGYFRNRDEATMWVVNEAAAWIDAHSADATRYISSAVDAPRAADLKRGLTSGRIVYDTLPPGHMPLHRNLPVPSVERVDIDCRQVDIVQAAHVNVDLFWV